MKRLIMLVLAIALLAVPSVFAQTVERIQFPAGGTSATVSGTLVGSGDSADSYVLYAFAGQQMTINLNPAVLTVISPTGTLMLNNTSGPYSVTLPETGDYHVTASVGLAAGTVPYTMTVSIVGTPTRKVTAERVSFLPGATSASVNGWVTGTSPDNYVLYAFAGQQMTLTLDNLSASINLLAPSGTYLINNGQNLASGANQVFVLTLPQTGDYRLQVMVPPGTALTGYTLTVGISALPTSSPTLQRISFAPGAISGMVSGHLDGVTNHSYVLYAFAGQQMAITLEPAGMMTVISPSGVPLLVNATNTTGHIVELFNQALPETGDYYITLMLPSGTPATDYNMVVTITGTPSRTTTTERISFMPGTIGTTVSGSVDSGSIDNYVLYAFGGQLMQVSAWPGAKVTLLSPSGVELATDTESPADSSVAGFTYLLPTTGDYTIQVTMPSGFGATAYDLTVIITN
ncbi:MAG: hypothetical protein H6670_05305 [Anaerolineaceae bacterium]|nr:hypothetical protein [Anaerolineaceae bacterium]